MKLWTFSIYTSLEILHRLAEKVLRYKNFGLGTVATAP